MGSDRGLCGGFNLNIVKEAVRHSKTLEGEVSLLCLGSKVPLSLPHHLKAKVIKTLPMKEKNTYADILNMAYRLEADHGRQVFHTCTVIYSHFKSAICCVPKAHQIIPLKEPMTGLEHADCSSLFGVDPEMDTLLKMLALKSVASHLYYASVESQRSEQSARMMAMDNATRSAEDMLAKLELVYHRSRQSAITNELIEIVAGAESL
jgi:F-type H+-transporting ATPase subunit gamma